MTKIKKFGTFSGVFTPSILTILGVIMYLRFPTIIGQAGLINTIGIIVIAHIISITTSLSVASLSTDKTVKTGGTYFMISRSLGLPIGGTLGLALFVGLSFSVSLYLIGFAESFLTYWNLDSSINSIRIAGTIILILVTTLTFISTSLAIKSQYFIMAAIVLSLLSIFFGHHEFTPKEIHLKPLADAAPFMILFGIFFPAVTGFEAGVSMSGDLKDAKKSLPIGAMAAVGVGFVVYLGLAVFYSLTVDAEALKNDPQILFKISLVPALVIIGIWGATLSSALGSILGAPRILQAIAMDKIAPRVFAKGTGKTQEPRNALLLAFVIAEAGILIGQLDVIARIVSMFFITTYAFLNLASAIESWSSSDFRPAFKIPRFVSILGATSAFIVMILLDFIALTGAVVVLGLLFLYLRRKELVLESGDAWGSFWTNLAKRALLKLSIEKTENRNWRPNIILFRGGKQDRLHLVEMGLAMSGKLGALTDFELVISSNAEIHSAPIPEPKGKKWKNHFFSRSLICNSLESGIKSVTSVYGFNGFEPNTVMMGWSRDPKNAGILANVITDLKKKNLNTVFLDYDKNAGFGKRENIDIWWNGKGRHLSFALNLMRFILSDAEWRDANLRILVINGDNKLTDKIHRNTRLLLEEKRMIAEIKIISDDFGTRTKEMIINSESVSADLIVLGVSANPAFFTEKYVESISQITDLPSSILILSPSDEFEEINFVGKVNQKSTPATTEHFISELKPVPVIENKLLKTRIEKLDEDLLALTNRFIDKTMNEAASQHLNMLRVLNDFFELSIKNTERNLENLQGGQLTKAINKNHQAFLTFAANFFEKQGMQMVVDTNDVIIHGIAAVKAEVGNYIFETPEDIMVPLLTDKLKNEKNISFPYRRMVSYSLNSFWLPEVLNNLKDYERNTVILYSGFKNIILKTNDIFDKWKISNANFEVELKNEKKQILSDLEELKQMIQTQVTECKADLLNTGRNQVVEISSDLTGADNKKKIRNKLKSENILAIERLDVFSEDWATNIRVVNNAVRLDCLILSNQKIIHGVLENFVEKINGIISEKVVKSIDTILINIENRTRLNSAKIKSISFDENTEVGLLFQETYLKISELIEKLPEEIEIADISYSEADESLENQALQIVVEPRKLTRFYFDTRLYDPFYRELEQLDKLVKQTVVQCREANSLLKFRLENARRDIESLSLNEKEIDDFLSSVKKQVLFEKETLRTAVERLEFKADEMLKNATAPLYSHSVIEAENKISTQLRERKGKKISRGISKTVDLFKGKINVFIVELLYSSSGGMIQARKYLRKNNDEKIGPAQILDIAEKQMPNPKVLYQIPVFYRTLFSSKSLINDDFWVSMNDETIKFKNAVQRHKNGFGGAVLITGVHGSGKTAFTRYSASHFFKKDRIFSIDAPLGGTVNPADWLEKLKQETGRTGESTEIFRSLPPESVVVINDLELWWERSNKGYAVLQEIINLIRVFGRKVFFIVNSNTYSIRQINKVLSMEDNFLSVIECNPFNTKKLQQLIQRRHKTSGLIYHYQNISEESVSQVRTASMFNHYFTYSMGVPGVAMNAWIGSIKKIENQDIYISKPETPGFDELYKINPEWLVIIALFIQHKNMSVAKLARVMQLEEVEANQIIDNLMNAGILEARGNGVFFLGRYLEPFLVKICTEKGII